MMPDEKKADFYSDYDEHFNKISVLKEQQEEYERSTREQREERDRKEHIRIKRIAASGGNQINYAVQKLVEKAVINTGDIRVSHYDLGFENTTPGMEDATRFLSVLKNNRCFEDFSKLADDSFRVINANAIRLKKYQNEISGNALQNKISAKRKTKHPNKPVIDLGINSKWEMLTMVMLENFKFKMIRGSDTSYDLDFQKIGYVKTSGGKLIEKNFLKDFILVLAINSGKYSVKGLNNENKAIVHTRKKEAKKVLMETFGFNDDPFKYNPVEEEYSARFKIIPPPKLRTIRDGKFTTEKVKNNKFSDLNDIYNESTPSM